MTKIQLNSIVVLQEENTDFLSPVIDCLNENHEVITIPLTNSTLKYEAQNLYNALSPYDKNFVIIAHSFNAFVAILFAKKYARLAKHIILLGCPSFNEKYASKIPPQNKTSMIMELLELRKSSKLIETIKAVRCPITFIHGKHDSNPYEGVLNVLNENDVDFEFILMDGCFAAPWNSEEKSQDFFRMLNVLVDEF